MIKHLQLLTNQSDFNLPTIHQSNHHFYFHFSLLFILDIPQSAVSLCLSFLLGLAWKRFSKIFACYAGLDQAEPVVCTWPTGRGHTNLGQDEEVRGSWTKSVWRWSPRYTLFVYVCVSACVSGGLKQRKWMKEAKQGQGWEGSRM